MKVGDTSINYYNKPVSPADFYGRRAEIQHIFDRLSRALGSSSIVGLEKSGKTSLLRYLSDPAVIKEHGFADEYVFIYFDFESFRITRMEFWRRILKCLQPEISDGKLLQMISDILKDEIEPLDLIGLFKTVGNQLKIVLIFDRFDNIIKDENFDTEFYSMLRSLTTNCNLAFIVATRRELSYYCHSEQIGSSPFFNIFTTIYLGPLSREESRTLLKERFESLGLSLSEKGIEYVMEITGGHPYLLQAACSYLFDAKRKHKGSVQEQLEYTRQRLKKEVTSFFHRCWDSCLEDEERRVLHTLARSHVQAGKTPRAAELNSSAKELSLLKNKGMIVESDQGYRLFSPIFAEWIAEQFPITEEDLTQRNPKIKVLAKLMHLKRQHEEPYVLTLGTTAYLDRISREVIRDSESKRDLGSLSNTERYLLIKERLDKEELPEGYQHLAELVKEAYFNLIFSTNFDSFLEDSLLRVVGLRSELIVLINRSRHDKNQIREALTHTSPRVKVVKIRGDLQDRFFALTRDEILEFCEEIKDILIHHLSKDVIVLAHNPDDDDVNHCLYSRKGGDIWYITPIEPSENSSPGRMLRATQRCRFICGRDGQFDNFFKALKELVGEISRQHI